MSNAVIRTGGKQFKVAEGDVLCVPSLAGEPGADVVFDQVLAITGDKPKIGTPTVARAKVTGTIVAHGRDKKIVVFKFKRRKRYMRKSGHRQGFTQVKITGIKA